MTEYALTSGALDGLTAAKTYSYLYGDSNWKDKLTSYNGRTIAYDAIGNPTTYYDGTTFVWQNGRELAGLTTQNGTGVVYAYDANGIRTRKTVGGVTTYYYTEGGNVVRQTNGTDTLWFYYDEGGSPVSFELNGTSYYYVKNLQGDVIAIVNASGTKLVEYQYDAWGKVTVASGSNANLAAKNPFRYRGYYYDSETGFYYLQSRYYDPQTGRFLNADAYADTGDTVLSTNMFAYCENDPVNCVDYSGVAKVRYPNTGIGKSTVEPISDIVLSAIKSKKVFKNAVFSYSSATSLQYTKDYHFVITMKKNKNGSIDIVEVIYRVKYATTSNFEASLMKSYKGYFNYVNNFVNNDNVGFAFSAYSDAGGDPRIVFAYNALYIAVNQKILAPKEVRLYYAAKKKGGKMIALVMSYNVIGYTKTKGGKKINYTQLMYKKYF